MADYYGIDSLLSGPAATTAKQVQRAFENSMHARDRSLARYSLPALANFTEDTALANAQTAAGLINHNQNLQDVIDASHHTPHGAENLSAYLPLFSGASSLIPWLFGRNATAGFMDKGLFGSAKDWITDHLGNRYALDANGSPIGMLDANGNMVPFYNTSYPMDYSQYGMGNGLANYDWSKYNQDLPGGDWWNGGGFGDGSSALSGLDPAAWDAGFNIGDIGDIPWGL